VLLSLAARRTPAGRTILGAAAVDDILAMLIVSVTTAVAASEGGGEVDVLELALVTGMALSRLMVAATRGKHPIEEEVVPLYAFFAPSSSRRSASNSTSMRSRAAGRSPYLPQ
jgi:hypothetical protein